MLGFLVAFVLLNGLRSSDVADFQRLAAHPFALLPDLDRQFLHGSPLTFFVAAPIAELFGPWAAWAIVTAGGFVLLAVAVWRFVRPLPPRQAETVYLVLASSPILLVLTRWIGKSDPFLVAFYLLLAAAPRRGLARAALAAAMVLCHREIGSVVLLVHLLCARRDVAPILAGLAAGHALILGYWHLLLPAPPCSRAQFADGHAQALLGSVVANPLVHVVCALNWFWIFFAAHARRARDVVPVVAVLAVAALAFDFTRVVVLCALPILLHVAVHASRATLPRARWFPLLFLIQFQVENAGRVHDWSWLR